MIVDHLKKALQARQGYRQEPTQASTQPPSYSVATGSSYDREPGPDRGQQSTPVHETDEIIEQALQFAGPPPAYSAHLPPLHTPVAVPQITNGLGMPFVRAWAPDLAIYGIDAAQFLAFLDNLNIIATKSPPLEVVNLAGSLIGLVPYHWFMLAGIATQAVAKTSMALMSKGRTSTYMKRVNSEFFAPRGLKAEIFPSKQLNEILGLDPRRNMVAPLEDFANQDIDQVTVMRRRMVAIERYICPLQFDHIPPPSAPTNALSKLCAKQVERDQNRSDKKLLENRWKALEKSGEHHGEGSKLMEEEDKVYRKAEEELRKARRESSPRKVAEEIAKIENDKQKELAKIHRERSKFASRSTEESDKMREDAEKDDTEIQAANKLLWIVIRSL